MRAVKMRKSGQPVAVGGGDETGLDRGAADRARYPAATTTSGTQHTHNNTNNKSGGRMGTKGGGHATSSFPVQVPPSHNATEVPRSNEQGLRTLAQDEDAPATLHDVEHNDADPLTEAFLLDAPLTFTARDDPQVVARLPLRFQDTLPTIDQQLLFRQRQDSHQAATDGINTAAGLASSSSPLSSTVAPELQAPSEHPPVSDFLRARLPVAVGRAAGCKTRMRHPVANEEKNAAAEENKSSALSSAQQQELQQQEQEQFSIEDEQRLYRAHVSEEVLNYLFCPSASSHGSVHAEGRTAEDEHDSSNQQNHYNSNNNSHHHHRGATGDADVHYAMVESCLSGLREVAADSVEYAQLLRRLLRLADTSSPETGGADDADVDLPPYLRSLLVGTSASIGSNSKDEEEVSSSPLSSTAMAESATSQLSLAGAAPRAPVVASTLRATLDALLPPRLLFYYLIHYEAAVEVQRQRREAQAQQAALQAGIREHPDDIRSREELAEVTQRLTELYAQTPVGTVLVVVERTSDVQAPRAYMHALEQSLDDVLQHCRARCCGRPLKLSSAAPSAQRAATTLSTVASLSPSRPADSRRGADKPTLKSRGPTHTATIVSVVKDPVCTHTVRPPPARPAALSSTGGGSASVATTLHVLELNRERTIVQCELLGEELLRQVTVDLPERGVLLRRLLDEARLSLEARGCVARERTLATQEHLLDGQDDREALVDAARKLEGDAAALRERLQSLQSRKAGLEAWAAARSARTAAERQARVQFEEQLKERLTAHTEAMKAAQDAARFSSLS